MKLLADFWQDVCYGTRLLSKNRRLTAGVVLTLAIVVGANSLVFSVVQTVLVRQLDYEHPDRLVQLWQSGLGGGGRGDWASFPNFKDWAAANRTFDDMAAYRFSAMAAPSRCSDFRSPIDCSASLESSLLPAGCSNGAKTCRDTRAWPLSVTRFGNAVMPEIAAP